jgi:serine phosphatase RsbU (regulator of sigma subunit)/anti-sigma regulatory factor (Ser/Thr protein kinase)
VRCLQSGEPVLVPTLSAEEAANIADAWQRKPVASLLTGASMLILPLIARDTNLGIFACTRRAGYRKFDRYDTEIGMEFAARAALFIDNARRYSRERATALALQRSLLPTGLSSPSTVEVRHRYLPGSKLIEVGGDWYESIALPGARVALVIGDVAGHGVHAAVTMGRLRAAIHTLAGLELPPSEALQQLDELMQTLGEREPHFATCVYAVFDAVNGNCEMASAGHLSPLLVRPDGSSQFLDIPPAPPLGIGGGPIESRQFEIEDGSLFVLYTDGLVENRSRDIDDGLNRLRGVFGSGSVARPLEDLCKATLDGVYADHQRDDIAVLMARLRRIPAGHHASWTLPAKPASVRRARALVGIQMGKWGLAESAYTAELLVSELVTNALAHATGDVSLRLILDQVLVCEVFDDAAAMPKLKIADDSDENGRGLRVVSQLAQRWGTRRTPDGKAVWFELALPETEPAGGAAIQ